MHAQNNIYLRKYYVVCSYKCVYMNKCYVCVCVCVFARVCVLCNKYMLFVALLKLQGNSKYLDMYM